MVAWEREKAIANVVNYRHVFHSLRVMPTALAGLMYRDQIFSPEAFRLVYEQLLDAFGERVACGTSTR